MSRRKDIKTGGNKGPTLQTPHPAGGEGQVALPPKRVQTQDKASPGRCHRANSAYAERKCVFISTPICLSDHLRFRGKRNPERLCFCAHYSVLVLFAGAVRCRRETRQASSCEWVLRPIWHYTICCPIFDGRRDGTLATLLIGPLGPWLVGGALRLDGWIRLRCPVFVWTESHYVRALDAVMST